MIKITGDKDYDVGMPIGRAGSVLTKTAVTVVVPSPLSVRVASPRKPEAFCSSSSIVSSPPSAVPVRSPQAM